METVGRIPFLVVTAVLGVVAFGLVVLGLELKLGVYSLALLAVPVGVAIFYTARYARDHSEDSGEEGEQFDDPVEEADRISSEPAAPANEPPTPELETPP